MGSLANLRNKLKPKFSGSYRFNESLVYKLMKARDKKIREHLHKLGVRTDDAEDIDTIVRRMALAEVTIVDSHNSDDNPRENFKVLCKKGKPVVAISEPFVDDKGNIMVRVVDPGANHLVITGA